MTQVKSKVFFTSEVSCIVALKHFSNTEAGNYLISVGTNIVNLLYGYINFMAILIS